MAPSIVFLDELDSLVGERHLFASFSFNLPYEMAFKAIQGSAPCLHAPRHACNLLPSPSPLLLGPGKRVEGEQTGEVTARLLSSFLTEMDGLELAQGVLVMGATNRPQALDAALVRCGSSTGGQLRQLEGGPCSIWNPCLLSISFSGHTAACSQVHRPGRFDVVLYVPPPDEKGRLQALQVRGLEPPADVRFVTRNASYCSRYVLCRFTPATSPSARM